MNRNVWAVTFQDFFPRAIALFIEFYIWLVVFCISPLTFQPSLVFTGSCDSDGGGSCTDGFGGRIDVHGAGAGLEASDGARGAAGGCQRGGEPLVRDDGCGGSNGRNIFRRQTTRRHLAGQGPDHRAGALANLAGVRERSDKLKLTGWAR